MVRSAPASRLAERAVPSCGAALALALLVAPGGVLAQPWWEMLGISRSVPVPVWSYAGETGPERWAELAPEFAACRGERQSPVDLRDARRLTYSPLQFRYRSSTLSLVNDGRSLRALYRPGSYLSVGGRDYQLEEFHFHLPGEHRINGAGADMELQLVHRDPQGQLAIVAVPMKAGRRVNTTLSRIWDHMPAAGGTSFYDRQSGINPLFLLPTNRSYFSYPGSLTEPPCTEGVEWFVLTEPVEVDESYLHRLRQVIGHNARPVQPLNGRPVIAVMR